MVIVVLLASYAAYYLLTCLCALALSVPIALAVLLTWRPGDVVARAWVVRR